MKTYKISEVAKLFNISRETLIYYDKTGLLKPSYVDRKTRYRFYTEDSIEKLGFILNLKNSNFSLNEIRNYLESDENKRSLDILENKLCKIDKQMKNLQFSKTAIQREIEEIKILNSAQENNPFIEKIDKISTYLISVNEPKGEYELQASLVHLKQFRKNKDFINLKRITILKKENYMSGEFFKVYKVGYVLPYSSKKFDELEGDTFICIYHREETKKIGESYGKLLKYIEEKKLKITGDSREFFNDLVVNSGNRKGRIIKICIPIEDGIKIRN